MLGTRKNKWKSDLLSRSFQKWSENDRRNLSDAVLCEFDRKRSRSVIEVLSGCIGVYAYLYDARAGRETVPCPSPLVEICRPVNCVAARWSENPNPQREWRFFELPDAGSLQWQCGSVC